VIGTEFLTILEPFYFQIRKSGLMKLPPHHMAAPRTSTPITPSTLPGLWYMPSRQKSLSLCQTNGLCKIPHLAPPNPKDQQCKMHDRKMLEVQNKLLTLSLALFFHQVLSPVPTVPHVELKSLVVRADTQTSDSGPNSRAAS